MHNLSLSGGNKINCKVHNVMESFDKTLSADHIFGRSNGHLFVGAGLPEEVGIRPVRLVTLSFSFFCWATLPFVKGMNPSLLLIWNVRGLKQKEC